MTGEPDQEGRRPADLSLRRVLFVLPNAMTLGSIFCGFFAIRQLASEAVGPEQLHAAALLLCFAGVLDLLDGRVARLTRTESSFGLQLDSLADVVSFGVAPALLLERWALGSLGALGGVTAFAFLATGAIRLARFNVLSESRQSRPEGDDDAYMLGLPIPPAATILVSLVFLDEALGGAVARAGGGAVVVVVTGLLSLLMVSTVRFRSFKSLRATPRTALVALFAVGSSALVWVLLGGGFVLGWLLAVYVTAGVLESVLTWADSGQRSVPPGE